MFYTCQCQCGDGIALGTRLELLPMDNGHPHRVTSQVPVSVLDKDADECPWMSLLWWLQFSGSGDVYCGYNWPVKS